MKLENLQKANDIASEISRINQSLKQRKHVEQKLIHVIDTLGDIEFNGGVKGTVINFMDVNIVMPSKVILRHLRATINADENNLYSLNSELEEL